jgi:hypothetical protein
MKNIDIEVENINLKGSGISLVDESLLNHSKLYQQNNNSAFGYH